MPSPENPEREFAVEVVRRLRAAGFEALFAGGCVRDLLLGREPEDYDVATSARPADVERLFRRTLSVGASFGVIIVLGRRNQGQVEVATFRADGPYLDGRRPAEITFCSAEQDALRRDFTINGMFLDPMTDEVIDYVGGQADLQAELIRAIGDARARFTEDKLRLLRAVRFAATLNFRLEPDTDAALREMADQISAVSPERIAQELRRALTIPNRAVSATLLKDTGLLQHILPEVDTADEVLWQRVRRTLDHLGASATFEQAMAALLQRVPPKQIRRLARRLRLANREAEDIEWLITHLDSIRDASTMRPAMLKRLLASRLAPNLIALVAARGEGSDVADAAFCEQYLAETPADVLNPKPLLTGNDLIQAGLQPGPKFKSVLDAVRDAQLDGTVTTPAAALELATQLAADAD